jgi:hypothetical protein
MPKRTTFVSPSALIVFCSIHSILASARLTEVGQLAQVIPGTLMTTVAWTGFGSRSGAGGSVVPLQPASSTPARTIVAPVRNRMVFSPGSSRCPGYVSRFQRET